MTKLESFTVYNRTLYTPKHYKEPLHKGRFVSKFPNMNIAEGFRDETHFVVDWEVQTMETAIIEYDSTPDSDTIWNSDKNESILSNQDPISRDINLFYF